MNHGELSTRMSNSQAHQQTRILVQAAAAACEDKKAEDTRILELDPIDSGLSDFFLVTSATNDRQAMAIADEIEYRLKKDFGVYANSVEGRRQGGWILLDGPRLNRVRQTIEDGGNVIIELGARER